jgi:plasmid rolling circle replication initiator protein Rep
MNITTKNPEIQDFLTKPTSKKISNLFLSEIYNLLDHPNKFLALKKCATYLQFAKNTETNERRLLWGNYCQKRLCPVCMQRLSMKRFANLSAVTSVAAKEQKLQFLFLTLTAKSVAGSELKSEIKKYFDSWRNLTRYSPEFKKGVHGWFRSLEVTYNQDTDEYHPHLHILLAVKSTYFKTSGYYITQKKWAEIWAHYLNIDYSPIVDIRKTYSKKSDSSAEQEAAKYTIKEDNYIKKYSKNLTKKIVEVLDYSLKRVRLIAYGGVLKTIHNQLKLDDDSLDLEGEISPEISEIIENYRWKFGFDSYKLSEE